MEIMQTLTEVEMALKCESERNVAKRLGVSLGTINRFKNGKEIKSDRLRNKLGLPVLVPACSVHGPACPHKCKPQKPKREKKPTWKLTPPKCECGRDLAFDDEKQNGELSFHCFICGTDFEGEVQTITRYKY